MNPTNYSGKTILFIVPHADDLHYQAGGTAALWAQNGATIISVAITDSSRGTRDRSATLEQMKAEGKAEALRAAAITGLSETRFLGYPDAFLYQTPYISLCEKFTELIRFYRPYVVITWDPFNPRELNPDHRYSKPAVYDATQYADYPLFFPEQLQRGLEPWPVSEFWGLSNFPEQTNEYVDISPVIETKIQALLEYRSQMYLAVDDFRNPLERSDPDSPLVHKLKRENYREIMGAFVREKARAVGEKCGLEYAEEFHVSRFGFPFDFTGFYQWLKEWTP